MRTIKTANGFTLNFEDDRVSIWQTNWQADEGIAISIYTGQTTSAEAPNTRRGTWHQLPVYIEATLLASENATVTPVTAWQAIADIKKAILGDGARQNQYLAERWPDEDGKGLAYFTNEVSHQIMKQEDSFEISGVIVNLLVQYETGKFNSYE
jgi:hypothetical protein